MALTDGLISYWKMDDSSGNPVDAVGNNTAVNSNVTFSSGKINNGAVFNGSSSNLKVATPSFNFYGTNKFTYNSFIKINSLASFGIIFQMRQDAGGTENLQLYLNNQTINSQFFTTSGNAGITTGNVITNTTDFFMVTTKYDGVSVYVYINGSLVGSPVALTGTLRQNNAFWMLGQNAVYGSNFNGVIDEVGVWNRDLSNAEIAQLYNGGSGLQYPFGTTFVADKASFTASAAATGPVVTLNEPKQIISEYDFGLFTPSGWTNSGTPTYLGTYANYGMGNSVGALPSGGIGFNFAVGDYVEIKTKLAKPNIGTGGSSFINIRTYNTSETPLAQIALSSSVNNGNYNFTAGNTGVQSNIAHTNSLKVFKILRSDVKQVKFFIDETLVQTINYTDTTYAPTNSNYIQIVNNLNQAGGDNDTLQLSYVKVYNNKQFVYSDKGLISWGGKVSANPTNGVSLNNIERLGSITTGSKTINIKKLGGENNIVVFYSEQITISGTPQLNGVNMASFSGGWYSQNVSTGNNAVTFTVSAVSSTGIPRATAILLDNVSTSSPVYTDWTTTLSGGGSNTVYIQGTANSFSGKNGLSILHVDSLYYQQGATASIDYSTNPPPGQGFNGSLLGFSSVKTNNLTNPTSGQNDAIDYIVLRNKITSAGVSYKYGLSAGSSSGTPTAVFKELYLTYVAPSIPFTSDKATITSYAKDSQINRLLKFDKGLITSSAAASGNFNTITVYSVLANKALATITARDVGDNIHSYNIPTIKNMALIKPQISVESGTGNLIRVRNDLVYMTSSFLTNDILAGSTQFNVDNGTTFSTTNTIALFGILGQENSEIMKIVGKAPTYLTTDTQSKLNHNRGEIVQQLMYDKISIEKSSTINGTYTVINDSIDIDTTELETHFMDNVSDNTFYYKVRFKNSLTGYYTAYSEPVTGYVSTPTSVGSIIADVRESIGNTPATDKFFISALNEAREIVDTDYLYGQQSEWRQVFDHPINLVAGQNYVDLPDDIDFSETNRSILAVRYTVSPLGGATQLRYVDKQQFNQNQYLARMSYVTTQANIGDTVLYLDNVGDFAEGAGVAYIASDKLGKTIKVTYTGRDFTAKKLTGCTITEVIPAGRQAWYQSFQTLPLTYTVFDGKIWFDKVIPDILRGRVIYMDYYKKMDRLENLTDEIPEKWRTAYRHFLRFANKRRLDDNIGKDDPDYQRFDKALKTIIGNNNNGQTIRIRN